MASKIKKNLKANPNSRKPYTTIYLIRHCQPDYSEEKKFGDIGMPLSKTGRLQRRLLTKKLMDLEIDKVYVSELKRAQETAELFLKRANKKMFVDKRLDEIDWQEWCRIGYFNMSEKKRQESVPNLKEMDGKLNDMQTKARHLIFDIFDHNRGKKIALFTHGNFIKATVTSILNADVIGFLCLEAYQASITKIVIDKEGFIKINYINNASHLPNHPNEDLFLALVD
ncbi:MAG: histidine phosphatase family protein [Planctomycetes bacterium]|jgi:broad specificity phosphatase PhoE|nr:histidine phosphatase family protein [Planctomycetota bacterium]